MTVSPFWREVRRLIHDIAVELWMFDHRELGVFNKPEECELREGGYLSRAKTIAFSRISKAKNGTLRDTEKNEAT